MSVHGKENGKGAVPVWVGLSCHADGRTEPQSRQPVKQALGARDSCAAHRARPETVSKCYCLVCCAGADFLQFPEALLRLLILLSFK